MINWISVEDDTPKECCNGISEKVLVAGIDDWGDISWGESQYYFYNNTDYNGFNYRGWYKITHWAYMPNLPEIK